MPILAIFDLDDTLTYHDTESLWLHFLVKRQYLDKAYIQKVQKKFLLDYQAGCLNFDDVIDLSMTPLSALTFTEQQTLQKDFCREILQHFILPEGQKLVQKHKKLGHTTLLISAGHHFLVEPASRFFSFDDLICSQLKRLSDGKYLNKLDGHPCYKGEKVIALKKWLKKSHGNFEKTYFYSDSNNDLPLLHQVDYPVATNPCPKLKQVAEQYQWPILNLKKDFSPLFEKITSF